MGNLRFAIADFRFEFPAPTILMHMKPISPHATRDTADASFHGWWKAAALSSRGSRFCSKRLWKIAKPEAAVFAARLFLNRGHIVP